MKPLRILHVLGQRPEMTGSGIYLEAITKESHKRGFANFRIAGVPAGRHHRPKESPYAESAYVFFESEELNFPVPGMSDVMPYTSSLFRDLKGKRLAAYQSAFTRALQSAVDRFDPNLIHTNHLFVLSALVRKLFPEMPVVATCHGTELRQYTNCPHLRSFVKAHCRRLDRVIALTADQKTDIVRLLDIPPEKIAVAGGGYDSTIFTRTRKSPAGTVQILYAGKINRSKGVPWLLRTLSTMMDQDWHLHMAGGGSGPEFDACMELAGQLGSRVTHHGYVSHGRLAKLMKTAHVQVLPSFFEGLPLVLFEGLASGCRIITTDLSGFTEIFGSARKETVDLIALPPLETVDSPRTDDEAALEAALRNSLTDMIDAVKRSPDWDDPNAERIASRYTWPRVFERITAVYHAAIEEHDATV
ncbi:MAG: glycosyltransferase family 4 protein [Desulfobacteraceae bacterium]|nr:glycosyltransferase family 4 protein [Desulfobacteraceae bacterium]